MKLVRGVITVLVWLILVALGGYVGWIGFTGAVAWDGVDFAVREHTLAMAAGVFLLLLAILWPLSLLAPTVRVRYLSFDNPGGEVRISLDAIRDFLSRLASEFPSVVSLRPSVCVRNAALVIDMDCRIRAGTSIPVFSRQMQERVRQSIQSNLGISEVQVVKVTVREIAKSPAQPVAEPVVRVPRPDEDQAAFEAPTEDEGHPK